ncbi:MAG TPA: chloride channel protein [Bryobacteraceae bacterium]|nr:chloride channel protein [Bryobacteraceae bacterium]
MSTDAITVEPTRSWRSRLGHWSDGEGFLQYEDKILLLLTLIIGAVVGLVVAGFIYVTENLGARMYPAGGAAWHRVLIPTLGALVTGWLLWRFFPNARGSGIPQTKAALFLRDGFITMRTVFGKFGCCSASLATGIALGREGPSVQVGAGIASALGRRLGLSPSKIRELVPVGAAAALAAAFNTPVAAVLFTLEEVMGDLHAPVLGSIVLGSATSWVTLHLLLGDEPLFHVPSYQLVSPIEFITYAVLGVAGGLVSVAFTKMLLGIRQYFFTLPKWSEWMQPAAGGLVVGLMGWFVPDVLGVGYSHVSEALNGQMTLEVMALLVLLKVVATASCYGTGNAGGIFGPALFMGAMLGGAIGTVAHQVLPDFTGGVGAYALVGMGALFAGIVRVPLTSVIMIFEMTRDYSIIVPLMIANLISFYISYRLQHEPIYEALQHQDGVHLPSGLKYRQELLIVRDAAEAPVRLLTRSDRIEDARALLDEDHNALPVMDGGHMAGMINLAQVEHELAEGHGGRPVGELVPADVPDALLTAENFPHLHMDHPLDVALRRIAHSKMNVLPVVGRSDIRDLKGIVSLNDILNAYGVAGEKAHALAPPEERHRPSPRLIPGVVAAGLAVLLLIGFLNYYYRSAKTQRAQEFYQTGNQYLQQNRDDEAVQQFRDALSAAPGNPQYRLALGLALAKDKHTAEASTYLSALLKRDPENALANLGEAHIQADNGKTADAVKLYRRAIDGSWPPGQDQARMQARFELVSLLGKAGQKTQAVAELLAALGPAAHDNALKIKIGQMLLGYGALREAADVFRNVVQADSHDAQAYAGLGEAELDMENYQDARDAFQKAVDQNPADQSSKMKLELSDRVLALDPNARGLRVAERYDRSKELLQAEVMRFKQCQPDSKAADPAVKALAARPRRAGLEDAADMDLELAKDLWKQGQNLCPGQALSPDDQAVDRVLARLSK